MHQIGKMVMMMIDMLMMMMMMMMIIMRIMDIRMIMIVIIKIILFIRTIIIDIITNSINIILNIIIITLPSLQPQILSNAEVIVSTCIGAGSDLLREFSSSENMRFRTVLIDEAAQCTETAVFPALTYGCERLVLIGELR